MSRDAQHVLLLLLGGTLLRIGTDGTFLRYVRPSQHWPLLTAGAVIVVLAGATFLHERRARRTTGASPHDHRHRVGTAWLLMAPILTIALVAPPALGADSVVQAADADQTALAADMFPPLPAGGAPTLGLSEVVQRALFDHTGALDARPITVVGFVVHRGAEIDLARLRISCCAADARPSRVRLAGDGAALGEPAQGAWLQVVGEVQPGTATAATHWVPTMVIRSASPIAAPADSYEY